MWFIAAVMAGLKRSTWPTARTVFVWPATAVRSAASATVAARGFSTSTGIPLESASRATPW